MRKPDTQKPDQGLKEADRYFVKPVKNFLERSLGKYDFNKEDFYHRVQKRK